MSETEEFKPYAILPGETISLDKYKNDKDVIKIGPGLLHEKQKVTAIKAGTLKNHNNQKWWIDSSQRRVKYYYYYFIIILLWLFYYYYYYYYYCYFYITNFMFRIYYIYIPFVLDEDLYNIKWF